MAYTTINKSTDYFNTKLYTGNSSTNAITGVGFQPDFTWIKNRSSALNHALTDSVRGAPLRLMSNTTDAEINQTTGLTSFDSDGFTVSSDSGYNGNGNSIVSWNWLGSNTTASNTDGSITSTVSANTTSGFSIVKFTGNGTSGATVGHGLGSAPKVVISKRIDGGTNQWVVGHGAMGGFTQVIYLNNTTGATNDSGSWNNTAPSSTFFTVGNNNESNGTGFEFISYCFAEKKGFSKFGKYKGNGSTDGTFIYTGFKPAFFLVKCTGTTDDWFIYDNKRDANNVMQTRLRPNRDLPDTTNPDYYMDFVSNGIKLYASNQGFNGNTRDYIYMAFAEAPLVGTNNIPATAR